MSFRIHSNVSCNSSKTREIITEQLNSNQTSNTIQEIVSEEVNDVLTEQIKTIVKQELDTQHLVTIDILKNELNTFILNQHSEVNNIKHIDISENDSELVQEYQLEDGDEFVVLMNSKNITLDINSLPNVYLPDINNKIGIEITIINLSANDVNVKTLAESIDDIDNRDYFYDLNEPLQSKILLCANYSLRFISYTENKWVNII